MSSDTTLRVRITGRVQGVSYRAWTAETARAHHLKGWVRNRTDGSVEAVFSGEEAKVHAMIEACKRGSTAARVDGIETFRYNETVEDKPFATLPTC